MTDSYKQVTSLKSERTKVMVSVGGPLFDDAIFSTMVSTAQNRTKFVKSALKEWKKLKFYISESINHLDHPNDMKIYAELILDGGCKPF